jgi:hypothetical protein
VNFNVLFKMKSWQSVLAADVGAAINRSIARAGEERRINLIGYDATLEHMLLSVGARNRGRVTGPKHLITGASARLTVSAAPDLEFNAGLSNFWQKRQSSSDTLAASVRQTAHRTDE